MTLPQLVHVWLGLGLLCSGCYLSHGLDPDAPLPTDVSADTRSGCETDAECSDDDRCTRDRCEAGRCTHAPIPFSRVASYRAVTGPSTYVAREGALALVLTDPLAVERFGASGPVGEPIPLTPTGGDRDWDSAIASNGEAAVVVTTTGPSIVHQVVGRSGPSGRPSTGLFVHAAWTGTSLVAIEQDFMRTCFVHEVSPAGGFVGAPQSAPCPHTPARTTTLVPPWYVPVRGARGETRLLSLTMDGRVVSWTPSGGERELSLSTTIGLGVHSLVAREVAGVLGAAWVREGDDEAAVVAGVLRETAGALVPVAPLLERPTPPTGSALGAYALWMSAADCSLRFVLVAADQTGLAVLELGRGAEVVTPWRMIAPFSRVGRISSACIDGGVVIVTWEAVHVLTCEP